MMLSTEKRDYLLDSNKKRIPIAKALDGKYVGLYFGAHFSPACAERTPQLVETYSQIRALGHEFEIVYMSWDHTPQHFGEHAKLMPFLKVPFQDEKIEEISQQLQVEDLPSLFLFDAEGDLITAEGLAVLDEEGVEGFPFEKSPEPVHELSINYQNEWAEYASLVVFLDTLSKDTQTAIIEAMKEVANDTELLTYDRVLQEDDCCLPDGTCTENAEDDCCRPDGSCSKKDAAAACEKDAEDDCCQPDGTCSSEKKVEEEVDPSCCRPDGSCEEDFACREGQDESGPASVNLFYSIRNRVSSLRMYICLCVSVYILVSSACGVGQVGDNISAGFFFIGALTLLPFLSFHFFQSTPPNEIDSLFVVVFPLQASRSFLKFRTSRRWFSSISPPMEPSIFCPSRMTSPMWMPLPSLLTQ